MILLQRKSRRIREKLIKTNFTYPRFHDAHDAIGYLIIVEFHILLLSCGTIGFHYV